ncbi:MAG TPA: serine hydrolase domain-containing protein [Myxococcaceae bacterium]|jgi:CubicO group peptidase (beta-lactamase class C family)
MKKSFVAAAALVWSALSHRESGELMTACSRVSIGSTTKSMTTLALMKLVEQGKMDLEAPLTRYLPWFQTADGQGGVRGRNLHLRSGRECLPERDARPRAARS